VAHTLINDLNQKYEVTGMSISEEDDGILVDGLPGWLCPILFEPQTDSDGNLEFARAWEVTHENGRAHKVTVSHFKGIGLEDAITEYLKS